MAVFFCHFVWFPVSLISLSPYSRTSLNIVIQFIVSFKTTRYTHITSCRIDFDHVQVTFFVVVAVVVVVFFVTVVSSPVKRTNEQDHDCANVFFPTFFYFIFYFISFCFVYVSFAIIVVLSKNLVINMILFVQIYYILCTLIDLIHFLSSATATGFNVVHDEDDDDDVW